MKYLLKGGGPAAVGELLEAVGSIVLKPPHLPICVLALSFFDIKFCSKNLEKATFLHGWGLWVGIWDLNHEAQVFFRSSKGGKKVTKGGWYMGFGGVEDFRAEVIAANLRKTEKIEIGWVFFIRKSIHPR